MNKLYNGDCLKILPKLHQFDMIFCDIPDNINLKYQSYKDNLSILDYMNWIRQIILTSFLKTDILWLSFNAKWSAHIGYITYNILITSNLKYKPCIQTFTFGQHNKNDFGNNHRPIWRFNTKNAKFYPKQIMEPSWRLLNNDARANPMGRVPGDVFNIPRVTGNSKQRKKWIPTQLNLLLLEKIIKFSTKTNDTILDLCAGSGSMLQACKNTNRNCDLIEIDKYYCEQIAKEHNLQQINLDLWSD